MIYTVLTFLLYPLLSLMVALRSRDRVERILVIQVAKIGDLVCSTPVLRTLRSLYPEASLTLLCDRGSSGILSGATLSEGGYIDDIIEIEQGDLKGLGGKIRVASLLRDRRFDLSIALSPSAAFNVIPLWALTPRRLTVAPNSEALGSTFRTSATFNTYTEYHDLKRKVTDTYRELFVGGGLCSGGEYLSELQLGSSAEGTKLVDEIFSSLPALSGDAPIVAISPGARNKLKEVEPQVYSALADKILSESGATVCLVGGPDDRDLAEGIMRAMRGGGGETPRVFNLTGSVDLGTLPELIRRFSLFISADSGPLYVAVAVGVPVINICGPCYIDERPLGSNFGIVQPDLECVPCSYTYSTSERCLHEIEGGGEGMGESGIEVRSCIKSVTPEDIFVHVERLLGGAAT